MATKFLESGSDATQDLSFYNASAGAVTSATDQSHTGTRSIKLSTGAGPTLATINRSGVLADTGRRISFWFRASAWTSTPAIFQVTKSDGTTVVFSLTRINSGAVGALQIIPNGATAANGSTVLAINTWYRISVSYYITNTTTYTIKMYINGVLDATANAGTLAATVTDTFQFRAGTAIGANQSLWFDDVYVDDGASSASQPDTGDIRATSKRAFANGTTNGFSTQIGAGGSGYGSGHAPQVNEQPLSTTNGWSMIGAGSAITEEYNIEAQSVGDTAIQYPIVDYMGWVYASAALSETGQIIVNNVASNISLTSSNTLFTAFAGSTAYPLGTGADIGIITSTTVTTVSLYECGVVVAFIVPPGLTFNNYQFIKAGNGMSVAEKIR